MAHPVVGAGPAAANVRLPATYLGMKPDAGAHGQYAQNMPKFLPTSDVTRQKVQKSVSGQFKAVVDIMISSPDEAIPAMYAVSEEIKAKPVMVSETGEKKIVCPTVGNIPPEVHSGDVSGPAPGGQCDASILFARLTMTKGPSRPTISQRGAMTILASHGR